MEPTTLQLSTVEPIEHRLNLFTTWLTKHAPKSMYNETFLFQADINEGNGVIAKMDLLEDTQFMR
jgi:hypothetical protein